MDTSNATESLWRVFHSGREHYARGRRYWHDNRPREPAQRCVIQAITQGQIQLQAQGQTWSVPADHLFLFGLGESTAYGTPGVFEQPMKTMWIDIDGAGLHTHHQAFREAYGPVIDARRTPALIEELSQLVDRATPAGRPAATDQAHAIHHFVMRLFEHAEQCRYTHQTPVQRAVAWLQKRPEGVMSLQTLAHTYGCSREHLSRVFAEQFGESAQAYLTRSKVSRGLYLLRETQLPLSAVAEQSGFASVHTLARQVKAATGQSPRVVRRDGFV